MSDLNVVDWILRRRREEEEEEEKKHKVILINIQCFVTWALIKENLKSFPSPCTESFYVDSFIFIGSDFRNLISLED